MDLSLEFPDKYHSGGSAVRTCRDTCALEGMINSVFCHFLLFWHLLNIYMVSLFLLATAAIAFSAS